MIRDDLAFNPLVVRTTDRAGIKITADEEKQMIFVTAPVPGQTKNDIDVRWMQIDHDNVVVKIQTTSDSDYPIDSSFTTASLLKETDLKFKEQVHGIYPDGFMVNEGVLTIFFKFFRAAWQSVGSKLDPRIDAYEAYTEQTTKANK